jgi:hypothetical protein
MERHGQQRAHHRPVAMYTWMNTGAQFDNVLVRNLGVPFSSVAPPARTPEPEPMPPPDPTRLAMLMPSHTDRSRGDRSVS